MKIVLDPMAAGLNMGRPLHELPAELPETDEGWMRLRVVMPPSAREQPGGATQHFRVFTPEGDPAPIGFLRFRAAKRRSKNSWEGYVLFASSQPNTVYETWEELRQAWVTLGPLAPRPERYRPRPPEEIAEAEAQRAGEPQP